MAIAGKNTTFKHGTHGAISSNTDFTGKMMSLSPSFDSEEVDATVFGDGFRQFEQSFKNATIDAVYKYDPTVFGQLAALYDGADVVTWEIGPDGDDTGKAKITGSMILKKLDPPAGIGDLLKINVSFRVTGAVVFGSFS